MIEKTPITPENKVEVILQGTCDDCGFNANFNGKQVEFKRHFFNILTEWSRANALKMSFNDAMDKLYEGHKNHDLNCTRIPKWDWVAR